MCSCYSSDAVGLFLQSPREHISATLITVVFPPFCCVCVKDTNVCVCMFVSTCGAVLISCPVAHYLNKQKCNFHMQQMPKMKIRCTVAQVQMIRSSLESKWRGTALYKHQKVVVRFGLSSWGVWRHHAEIKRVRGGPPKRTPLMIVSLSAVLKRLSNNSLLVSPLLQKKKKNQLNIYPA